MPEFVVVLKEDELTLIRDRLPDFAGLARHVDGKLFIAPTVGEVVENIVAFTNCTDRSAIRKALTDGKDLTDG